MTPSGYTRPGCVRAAKHLAGYAALPDLLCSAILARCPWRTPMTLGLATDELALQARAREFAQDVARPRGAEIDRQEQYPWDIVRALTDAKFVGMTIPETLGGQGRSFLDAVLVIEEMAKFCTVTARIVVETNMGAISTVMAYGTPQQKRLAADLVLAGDKPAMGLRGMPEGELVFENLEVPAAMAVLPPSGWRRGFADLMNAYNSQRVGA